MTKTCASKDFGGLGFRELVSFNRALLAKQGWRILNAPDSLLSASLKARYFPRCNFFEAKLGYYPSFAWRSMICGRPILEDGVKWNVRDGRTTRIWGDNWIPNAPTLTRPSPFLFSLQEPELVRDLMNEDGTTWNRPLVSSLFSCEIVNKILSIPISNSRQEDCFFWKHTRDGNYSVKSGYWVAKRLKDASSSTPSSSSNNHEQWRWFWALNIPPKLKLFMWRCMRGILQTKSNLITRGISIDPVCSRCGNEAETLEHILRDCPWSNFYWKACTLRFSENDLSPHPPLQDWILYHIKNKSNEFNEAFVALLWMNWKARNLLEFQQRDTPHMDCFNVALSLLWEFQKAALQSRITEAPQIDHHHWNPPQQGWIKFNSDASLGPLGVTGLGGIFRDCAGLPIRIISNSIPFCNDIELAEAMACLNGLIAAKEEGFRAVIFEMDNQTLYSKLRNGVIPRNQVGTVISDILFIANDFERIVFQWARRTENRVAHIIANRARHPGLINHSDSSICVNLERLIVADATFCQSI